MFYAIISIGVWILISPWLLGFAAVALGLWSNIIAGLVLIILGIYGISTDNEHNL